MLGTSTTIVTATLALLLQSASALAAPPPQARVKSATLAGSGCPAQAAVDAKLTDDGARLVAALPDLSAAIGGATKKRLARVNCELIVTIEHSPGYQLAPAATQLRISGRIAPGAEGQLSYKYYYQGQAATPAVDTLFTTPGAVAPHPENLKPRQDFSPCAATTTLVQGYALRLLAKGAHDDDQSDLKATGVGATELVWRLCQ